jgi:hypothetical protein
MRETLKILDLKMNSQVLLKYFNRNQYSLINCLSIITVLSIQVRIKS